MLTMISCKNFFSNILNNFYLLSETIGKCPVLHCEHIRVMLIENSMKQIHNLLIIKGIASGHMRRLATMEVSFPKVSIYLV